MGARIKSLTASGDGLTFAPPLPALAGSFPGNIERGVRGSFVLNIRLARTGRKRDAHFRVVVSDGMKGRVGRIVETVGHYHPRMPKDAEGRLHINTERARYWLSTGARPSPTVRGFLRPLLGEMAAERAEAPDQDPPDEAAAG